MWQRETKPNAVNKKSFECNVNTHNERKTPVTKKNLSTSVVAIPKRWKSSREHRMESRTNSWVKRNRNSKSILSLLIEPGADWREGKIRTRSSAILAAAVIASCHRVLDQGLNRKIRFNYNRLRDQKLWQSKRTTWAASKWEITTEEPPRQTVLNER